MAKKIAIEYEARNVGGKIVVVSQNKCATMQKAIDCGCKRISSYSLNQLVPLADLKKDAAYSFVSIGELEKWESGQIVDIVIKAGASWWIKQTSFSMKYGVDFSPDSGSAGSNIQITARLTVTDSTGLKPVYVDIGLYDNSWGGKLMAEGKIYLSMTIG